MPRDSNGNTQPLGGTIVSTGDPILPSQHNPALIDLYEMMSQSLSRDGQGGMRANLNMNGFRIINVSTSSASGDLATVGLVNSTVDTKVNDAIKNKVTGDWVTTVGLIADNPNSPYMRRTADNSIVNLQVSLGFTPVQQGGGIGQGSNKIRIGWGSGSRLLLQVDNSNFNDTWPINISGTANITSSQVGSAIAGQGAGSVGTYSFLSPNGDAVSNPGDLWPGASMRYASFWNSGTNRIGLGGSPSGTWMCMGYCRSTNNNGASVWKRVS